MLPAPPKRRCQSDFCRILSSRSLLRCNWETRCGNPTTTLLIAPDAIFPAKLCPPIWKSFPTLENHQTVTRRPDHARPYRHYIAVCPAHDSAHPPVRFCPGGRRAPACAEKTNPEARLPQCEPDKADTKGYEGRAGIDQYSVVRPCK